MPISAHPLVMLLPSATPLLPAASLTAGNSGSWHGRVHPCLYATQPLKVNAQ